MSCVVFQFALTATRVRSAAASQRLLGLAICSLGLSFLGCGAVNENTQRQRIVTVAAAANLKFALDQVIDEFESQHPGIRVQPTYGSSGNFYAQLSQGAPFDIFFSADRAYVEMLIEQGVADQKSEFLYAIGQIVVWTLRDSSLDVQQHGIQAMLNPSVRKIAIANPQHAPYGRAAEAALKNLGLYNSVQEFLVLGDNVAQTAQFVESGAADIGIIALSLALTPQLEKAGEYWVIPMESYPALKQSCVILNHVHDREATELFRGFVAGPQGKLILSRYGFFIGKD